MKPTVRLIATFACVATTLALPIAAVAEDDDDSFDATSLFAGNGNGGYRGDGGPATDAKLDTPRTVAPAPGGGHLIADTANGRIRHVAADGTITTVAGTGGVGFNGDALPATMADLNKPEGVALTRDGGFLIADTKNNRIRKVQPGLGLITTVAGNGAVGDGAEGQPATLVALDSPTAVAPTADGGFLIADNGNDKIRKVSALGNITTVAGDGTTGFGGDGATATLAQLDSPVDVAATADGGFLIADKMNNRIRKVAADGTISTVAGDGSAGYGGDGNLATLAQLDQPAGVEALSGDDFLIADTQNDVVRRVKSGVIETKLNSLDKPSDVLRVGTAMLVADTNSHVIRLFGTLPWNNGGGEPADDNGGLGLSILDEDRGSVLPELDAPTLGVDLNVARTEGTVRVKLPGAADFVPLGQGASIPFGSVVDAKRGTVRLTSARNDRGSTQSAAFKGSAFKVTQKRSRKPVTDLRLRGGSFDSCGRAAPRAGMATIAANRRKRRSRRHLWGSGHGRFRTIGRHGAATVRGTIWLTADRCKGTLVRVRRGKVAVRDFRAHKTVSVRAGQSHFARANPRHARRR